MGAGALDWSLELIFHSSLRAVGENPELFSDKKILQELITSTVTALTDDTGRKLFSESALLNPAGDPAAIARSTWLRLD